MKEAIITRCFMCLSLGLPGFVEVKSSYPVKVLNYTYDQYKHKIISSLDSLYICEDHFNSVVKVKNIKKKLNN